MNLLQYEKLEVDTKAKEGKNVKVIIFNKSENDYTIHNKDFDADHNVYLNKIKAGSKSGEVYLNYISDGEIFAYVSIGDLNVDILKQKESMNVCGANLLGRLSYLDGHINIYIQFDMLFKEFVAGIILSSYKYSFLKKDNNGRTTLSIIGDDLVKQEVLIYNAQNFARFLGDTPANLMTPSLFVKYAKQYCRNLEVKVYDEEFMKINNMNLILGVSQGSIEKPKLLFIRYNGKIDSPATDLALVGKGVTFDSGGISLKPPSNMSNMKGDMMGAATVLCAARLAFDFNLELNIEVTIPLTENMPSGSATKPGDVHCGMSGISVEVDNTDAEGRLILADAMSFAQKSNPKILFDVATLTGAVKIALGDNFTGYFCNDDNLSSLIYESGINSNDPSWRMPLSPLYLRSMKSDVADLKNSGKNGKGGSATAAIFLNEFVNKDVKWAHFDIAGVSRDHDNKKVYGAGRTGRGVPLVFEILRGLSRS